MWKTSYHLGLFSQTLMKRADAAAVNLSMFDPFDILGLEKKYSLESKVLEKAYFDAQKKTHPDQFTQASPEEKQAAGQLSTVVNQAYVLLKDPLKRAEWFLKNAGIEFLSHDPLFLAEIMEWREKLEGGIDIRKDLLEVEKELFKYIEDALHIKNYEKARSSVYRLHYIQKLLKETFHATPTS